MHYEFDPFKDDSNFNKHGLRLSDAEDFGYVGERLCVMVFCLRESAVRIISLRKANLREVKSYAKA